MALKRGSLLIETLLGGNFTAYLFAQSLGSDPRLLASFLDIVRLAGKKIEYFHYPFDPYALMRIDDRIVIDCRPIGANNSIVSAYLARARLFVHTSTTEGISNSVMEALLSDVHVLLCEDIRGPLQNLSLALPQCFTRSAPDARALTATIGTLLASRRTHGAVRSCFLTAINPFEVNRRVVLGAQVWFARNKLPWKGHCLGLFSGVQSKIDLAEVSAEQSYRGGRHIYPSANETEQCLAFQLQIAANLGRTDHATTLRAELQFINEFLAGPPPSNDKLDADKSLDRFLASLAEFAAVKRVLVIGMSKSQRWQALTEYFGCNSNHPQVHCLEDALDGYESLVARFGNQPFLQCHYASSVPAKDFPKEEEVIRFYHATPGRLREYPLSSILEWLRTDLMRMSSSNLDEHGVQSLLDEVGVAHFDMVIIDGREFTGFSELQRLIDANIIVLGCTDTFKNHSSNRMLLGDSNFELLFSSSDAGNGIAVFAKKEFLEQGGVSLVSARKN